MTHPNAPDQHDERDGDEQAEEKPLPHDIDAEAACLSAMLLDPAALDAVLPWLEPKHFFPESHRRIAESIVDLYDRREPVDVVQVATWLRHRGRIEQIGGMAYLTEVLNAAPAITNVAAYARQVVDLWRMRETMTLCETSVALGRTRAKEPRAFVAMVADAIGALSVDLGSRTVAQPIATALVTVHNEVTEAYNRGTPNGIRTGLVEYDDLTAGLHEGEFTVIGARPGMGKTAALISIARYVTGTRPPLFSEDGASVAKPQAGYFWTGEMPATQIARRALAAEASVSISHLRTGRIEDDEWPPLMAAAQHLSGLHLYLDEEKDLHVRELVSRVRRKRRELEAQGVELRTVFVDYLQLLRGDGYNVRSREGEISAVSRGLRLLALEGFAVVAGAQLNRDVEGRQVKKPTLADLRESGSIEQDAQQIVFLYRPEVYGVAVPPDDQGICEWLLQKQRDGRTGVARTRYRGTYTRFENFDH